MRYKLVCFDMDGTLIRNTNSVKYLCVLNNKEQQVLEVEKKESDNELSWIEADYIKARLIKGLPVARIKESFDQQVKLIQNIALVVDFLRGQGIKAILITAGPVQVAEVMGEKFHFDRVYGSLYETKDGIFTGTIVEHLGGHGKWQSLLSFCNQENIPLQRCIAVGDSASDTEVFRRCGKSIAVNYSPALAGKADIYLKTDDLKDILEHLQ